MQVIFSPLPFPTPQGPPAKENPPKKEKKKEEKTLLWN